MPLNFLDLDPINQPTGRVKIGGREYDVWPIKVGTVINLSAPGPDADGNGHFGQRLEQSLAILQQLIPDVPADELRALTIQQLNTLMTWAQETAYRTVEKNSETPTETAPTVPSPSTSPAC
jgi:hypothetical protein